MGPAKKGGCSLGKCLLRVKHRNQFVSSKHTTLDDQQPEAIASITENTSIDEFLTNAEAAQRSFEAERGIAAIANLGVMNDDVASSSSEGEGDADDFFSIPKKPDWEQSASAAAYKQLETDVFLKWKRQLNKLQNKYPSLCPFEKNLEFWRQLWKIIELSDVVVQVVDARDPLFYASHDLCQYVTEVSDGRKFNVLLVNKADFLTPDQREMWASYFKDSDMKAIFFSATGTTRSGPHRQDPEEMQLNTSEVFDPPQVIEVLKTVVPDADVVTVGFLGYPNVGKSSAINRFLQNKRLQVSATPGKTKHYQTHVVAGGKVTLVDGPGLVIPNLKMTKDEMVLSGILPIDNLTQHTRCIEQLLNTRLSISRIVKYYGITPSCMSKGFRDSRRCSSRKSQQLLFALGLMRGFMKPGGIPDESRAARVVLKDFVEGKLLFCRSPPNVHQKMYDPDLEDQMLTFKEVDDISLEESFPELRVASGVHVRGHRRGGFNDMAGKKHGNKKKREKLRRVYPDSSH